MPDKNIMSLDKKKILLPDTSDKKLGTNISLPNTINQTPNTFI